MLVLHDTMLVKLPDVVQEPAVLAPVVRSSAVWALVELPCLLYLLSPLFNLNYCICVLPSAASVVVACLGSGMKVVAATVRLLALHR